jgi:hypothetical protein
MSIKIKRIRNEEIKRTRETITKMGNQHLNLLWYSIWDITPSQIRLRWILR